MQKTAAACHQMSSQIQKTGTNKSRVVVRDVEKDRGGTPEEVSL